jgi:hypothetical protein
MNQFMVEMKLPVIITSDLYQLIPSQRTQINRLLARGVILSYSLSMDRKKIWSIVSARSEAEVIKIINTFPIIEWLDYTIFELAFNNNISQILPKFSLN